MNDNPLLLRETVPLFDRIKTSHVEPAIRTLLQRLHEELPILERTSTSSWEFVERLIDVTEPLSEVWGIVNHLMGVQNSAELRAAHQAL